MINLNCMLLSACCRHKIREPAAGLVISLPQITSKPFYFLELFLAVNRPELFIAVILPPDLFSLIQPLFLILEIPLTVIVAPEIPVRAILARSLLCHDRTLLLILRISMSLAPRLNSQCIIVSASRISIVLISYVSKHT